MTDETYEVEFVGGPFEGVQRFDVPAAAMPEHMAMPLDEQQKPHRNEGKVVAFAHYERKETDGVVRYHFTGRIETASAAATDDSTPLNLCTNEQIVRELVHRTTFTGIVLFAQENAAAIASGKGEVFALATRLPKEAVAIVLRDALEFMKQPSAGGSVGNDHQGL
jgi:hypothetical protein